MTLDSYNRETCSILSKLQSIIASSDDRDINIQVTKNAFIVRRGFAVVYASHNPEPAAALLAPKAKQTNTDAIIDEIYNAYPRKRDKYAAYKAIRKAIKDPSIPVPLKDRAAFVLKAVKAYATHIESTSVQREMVPYPATWFNRGSYLNSIENQQTKQNRKTTSW